jgi:hypothetical protein
MSNFDDPTDWNFTKCPKKPKYNEGDRISTSANPKFTVNFIKNPITAIHLPCGYWDNFIQYEGSPDIYIPVAPFKPIPKSGYGGGGFKNCYGVAPLVWATSNPSDMNINSHTYVGVTGGIGPFYWSIEGEGFSFDGEGKKLIETAYGGVNIYTTPDACGHAYITVYDRCSSTVGGIRCEVGRWEVVVSNGGVPYDGGAWAPQLASVGAELAMGARADFIGTEVSKFSDDNRYFVGPVNRNYCEVGEAGVHFPYSYSAPSGWHASTCLDTYKFTDPYVGVFKMQLFDHCGWYMGAYLSGVICGVDLSIYEWKC